MWFDAREFKQLPVVAEKPKPLQAAPLEAREANGRRPDRHAEMAQWEAPEGRGLGGAPPEEPWKWIPVVFGLPVESDVEPVRSIPWLTWGLVVVLALVYLVTFRNLKGVVEQLGFVSGSGVPSRRARTWLTSFFLHAGLLHLLTNGYFLLIFGDNVEDYLGRWRYLALLVLRDDLRRLATCSWSLRGELPSIGASGGISGVIVFYALKFPRVRLAFPWCWFYWVRTPALRRPLLWYLLQFLGAAVQVSGQSNVSSLAHSCGALVGLAAWIVWRNR